MDCSPPGSSVHGVSQAGIVEWVPISFSRGAPSPGMEPGSPALQVDALLAQPPGKPLHIDSISAPCQTQEWAHDTNWPRVKFRVFVSGLGKVCPFSEHEREEMYPQELLPAIWHLWEKEALNQSRQSRGQKKALVELLEGSKLCDLSYLWNVWEPLKSLYYILRYLNVYCIF